MAASGSSGGQVPAKQIKIKEVIDAICDGYDSDDLTQLVIIHFPDAQDKIDAPRANRKHIVNELVQWAIRQNRLADLILAASTENNRNPKIQDLVNRLGLDPSHAPEAAGDPPAAEQPKPPAPQTLFEYVVRNGSMNANQAISITLQLAGQLIRDRKAAKHHKQLGVNDVQIAAGENLAIRLTPAAYVQEASGVSKKASQLEEAKALGEVLYVALTGASPLGGAHEPIAPDRAAPEALTAIAMAAFQGLKHYQDPEAIQQRLTIYSAGDWLRAFLANGWEFSADECAAIGIRLCEQMERAQRKGLPLQNMDTAHVKLTIMPNRVIANWVELGAAEQDGRTLLDAAGSVHAMGCVLFEMLTGEAAAPDLPPDKLRATLAEKAPLQARFGLNSIVERALQSDPLQSFRSVTFLRERLNHYLIRLKQAEEIGDLIRATYPIVYLETWEEERAFALLRQIANTQQKKIYLWTVTQGLRDPSGALVRGGADLESPVAVLAHILRSSEQAIYVLFDLHPFLQPQNIISAAVRRQLRDWADQLRPLEQTQKSLVLVSPVVEIPPECEKDISLITLGPPTPSEIADVFDRAIALLQESHGAEIKLEDEAYETILRSAAGLTLRRALWAFTQAYRSEIEQAQNSSEFGAAVLAAIVREKEQALHRSSALELYSAHEVFSDIGGLENLKAWARKRALAFSLEAQEFGLSAPKGLLLVGVSGCGKSLAAKALASEWKMPLLRLDAGAIFQAQVGKSEANVRTALQVAEAIAPCVLWIDEIEKSFSANTAINDSGVSQRIFGTLVTWMQEKTAPVFLVATANTIGDVDNGRQPATYAQSGGLPPELLRKGRFDDIFFVDLPNQQEREHIFRIHIEKRGHSVAGLDLAQLARGAKGFSGAEIEQAVISALSDAYFHLDTFYGALEDVVTEFTEFASSSVAAFSDEEVADSLFRRFLEVFTAAPHLKSSSDLDDVLAAELTDFEFADRLRTTAGQLPPEQQEEGLPTGISQELLLASIQAIYPLSNIMAAQIEPFRRWASANAVPASRPSLESARAS